MKPLHILVVDDDAGKLMFLARGIRREFPKASIFECHSGKEALEYFKKNHVDALITNHSMRPINGMELVTAIRRHGCKIPIIMVSAHDDIKAIAEGVGVDLFLTSAHLAHIGTPMAEYLRSRGLTDRSELSSA